MNDALLTHGKQVLAEMSTDVLGERLVAAGISVTPIEVTERPAYITIIKETMLILEEAWESADRLDLCKLRKYHDTLDIPTLTPADCTALLRSCCRVRSIYPHWYELRTIIVKHLQKDPSVDIYRLLRGLTDGLELLVPM